MAAVNILILALLILLNGVFAFSEMALVSSRPARLRQLEAKRVRGAAAALRLHAQPNRFLSTIQVGITLIGVATGALGGAMLAAPLSQWLSGLPMLGEDANGLALGIIVALTAYVTLIVGELVPKRIALRHPERFAALVARPMNGVARAAAPAVWVLEHSSAAVLKLLRMNDKPEDSVTEDEVRGMIVEGTRTGVFDPREQAMIDGVLRLDDRSTRSAMVPRPNVVWLDVADDLETIRRKIVGSGHSRFPVCDGEVDNVLGLVRTRDILDPLIRGQRVDLRAVMSEPLVVPDATRVIRLLDRFKSTGIHMGIVVDEYGSLEGIITVTRVMEIIAGDLSELDQDAAEQAVQRADGSWLIDGRMSTDDFTRILGLEPVAAGADYHTAAGLMLHCLQRVPGTGDQAQWRDLRLEVLDMDGQRIDKLLATRVDDASPDPR